MIFCGSVAITFIEGAVETIENEALLKAGQKSWGD